MISKPFIPSSWLLDKQIQTAMAKFDADRHGMFRDHHCWKCRDGAKPCAQGNPRQCEFPVARNH